MLHRKDKNILAAAWLVACVFFFVCGHTDATVWPISNSSYESDTLTSPFGIRNRGSASNPVFDWHAGIDIRADQRTHVHASDPGWVDFANWNDARGWNVEIWTPTLEHPIRHGYYHLDEIQAYLEPGLEVWEGTIIAWSGNSGTSTNQYHLHYVLESLVGQGQELWVNPMNHLPYYDSTKPNLLRTPPTIVFHYSYNWCIDSVMFRTYTAGDELDFSSLVFYINDGYTVSEYRFRQEDSAARNDNHALQMEDNSIDGTGYITYEWMDLTWRVYVSAIPQAFSVTNQSHVIDWIVDPYCEDCFDGTIPDESAYAMAVYDVNGDCEGHPYGCDSSVFYSYEGGGPYLVVSGFSAEVINTGVQLTWHCLQSPRVKGVQLHRGLDSLSGFQPIGTQIPTTTGHHSFVDAYAPAPAICYYKYELIYNDGRKVMSREYAKVVNRVPHQFEVSQNYPNPFNSSTRIRFSLSRLQAGRIELVVYDVLGRRVKRLLDGNYAAGTYSAEWNGTNEQNEPVSSGLYFYKLQTSNESLSKKMILVK